MMQYYINYTDDFKMVIVFKKPVASLEFHDALNKIKILNLVHLRDNQPYKTKSLFTKKYY